MWCKKCKRELPESAFYKGVHHACKQCICAYNRAYRAMHYGVGDGVSTEVRKPVERKPVAKGECCGTCHSFSPCTIGGWCIRNCKSTTSGNYCPKWKAKPQKGLRYEEEVQPITVFNTNWE